MFFTSIDSPYRISNASTTHMHTCLLRATDFKYPQAPYGEEILQLS